jgi:hypothetical protein
MKKSELMTGMRVRTRSGKIYLVVKDIQHANRHEELAFISKVGFMSGSSYDDNLIIKNGYRDKFDIVEVYTVNENPNSLLQTFTLDLDVKNSIWKRQEYTAEQKEIFKALKTLGFNWIARDDINDALLAYDEKPRKKGGYWIVGEDDYACDIACDFAFDFIKGEDEEPFKIPEL